MVERAIDDPDETVQIAAFDYYVIRFVSEDTKPTFFKNAAISSSHRYVRLHFFDKYSDFIPPTELVEVFRDRAVNDQYWRVREKSIHGFVSLSGKSPEVTEFLTCVVESAEVNTIRASVMELLVAFRSTKKTWRLLLERLAVDDPDYLIRRTALQHLFEYFNDDPSVNALISKRAADDTNESVRRSASGYQR